VLDSSIRAKVQVRKVWTEIAAGSTYLDAHADDRLLYLGPFEIPSATGTRALASTFRQKC
jgi:hypothetical protein